MGWCAATGSKRRMTASLKRRAPSRSAPSGWSRRSEIGEHRRARELCEKLLSYASPLELYAEEIDPKSGRHLANFPQASTPLALINAVMHVIQTEQAVRAAPRAAPTQLVF